MPPSLPSNDNILPALGDDPQYPLPPPPPVPQRDGQNHDRMETDDESDTSSSDINEDTPDAGSSEAATEPVPAPFHEDQAMDTTPDNRSLRGPVASELQPVENSTSSVANPPPPHSRPHSPAHTGAGVLVTGSTGETQVIHIDVPINESNTDEIMQAITDENVEISPEEREYATRLLAVRREAAGGAPGASPEARAVLEAAERELSIAGEAMTRADRARADRGLAERRDRDDGWGTGDGAEGDEDSDDSESEDEDPYWTRFKEDTSPANERELRVIETTMEEKSALDHDHWESIAYESLDDPEYIPEEAARIEWVVEGVHGTPEKPNRQKIMRSPSKKIGNFYWNIKYFPHGNDGTEQLSIYIECSPFPYEEIEAEEKEKATVTTTSKQRSIRIQEPNDTAETTASAAQIDPHISISVANANDPAEEEMPDTPEEAATTSSKQKQPEIEGSWCVSAQISCVIYNPDEPRVNATQKGCHRFCNDSPDWGWTRFHGPWDSIHKRQRFQRTALLRNDTLSFTAYIRTVQDKTKALWFHPSKDKPSWDCLAMTGVRPFNSMTKSSACIAAISTWLHLQPIIDITFNIDIPDFVSEADKRPRPASNELQYILNGTASLPDIDLSEFITILNFYGAKINSNTDVVAIWEALRRTINFEASIGDSMETDTECFQEVLLLKQPDPFTNDEGPNYVSQGNPPDPKRTEYSLVSVQSILDQNSQDYSSSFRIWESYAGQPKLISVRPKVLQVELPRQSFSTDSRKWRKSIGRIHLNEIINYSSFSYTLFGLVVHSGDLESKEYYSVIRPKGPGTTWLKYASDFSSRKVENLTTQQAVTVHEGSDDCAYGSADVAYIATYVLTDSISEILCTPFHSKLVMNGHIEEHKESAASKIHEDLEADQEEIPLYVYNSDQFHEYTGRGLCDPWKIQSNEDHVKMFSFLPKTTIEEVKKHLSDIDGDDVVLWSMNTNDTPLRAYPELASYESYKCSTVEDMGLRHGKSCHFWMAPAKGSGASIESPVSVMTREHKERDEALSIIIRTCEEILNLAAAQRPSDSWSANNDTHMTEVGSENASGAEEQAPSAPTSTDAQREEYQRLQEERRRLIEENRRLVRETQHQLHSQRRRHQAEIEALKAARIKDVWIFVKVFDPKTKSLQGVSNKICRNDSKIIDEVKKLLKVDTNERWDIYHERNNHLSSKDIVESPETFRSRLKELENGIFIAQRRLTPDQITAFEAQCSPTSPVDYFLYLRGYDNPSFFRNKLISSYFSSPYNNVELVNGRIHGFGRIVNLAGDAYEGCFVAGKKHGQGEMRYANGDTYKGEWAADEPNGQGTNPRVHPRNICLHSPLQVH